MPPIPLRSGRKRPVWVTVLMLVLAGGVWFAQQRGWLAKPAQQGNQQASQQTNVGSDSPSSGDRSPSSRDADAGSNRDLPDPRPQVASNAEPARPNQSQSQPAQSKPGSGKPTASKPDAAKPAVRPKGTVTAAEIDASNTANMSARERAERPPVSGDQLDELYKQEKNLVWVEGTGKVIRVLSDDTDGSKHQRFTMANSDGHEVMVAHNIDLSPRAPVKEGDTIAYRGEYIWTDRGGKVHFTHKPQYGNFNGGWIEVGGKRYE
jgi:hypothetical protein